MKETIEISHTDARRLVRAGMKRVEKLENLKESDETQGEVSRELETHLLGLRASLTRVDEKTNSEREE